MYIINWCIYWLKLWESNWLCKNEDDVKDEWDLTRKIKIVIKIFRNRWRNGRDRKLKFICFNYSAQPTIFSFYRFSDDFISVLVGGFFFVFRAIEQPGEEEAATHRKKYFRELWMHNRSATEALSLKREKESERERIKNTFLIKHSC